MKNSINTQNNIYSMVRHMKKNIIGKKINRFTIIESAGKDKYRNILWLCVCECGKTKIIRNSSLLSEKTKSCGCLRSENGYKKSQSNIKHGHSKRKNKSRIYIIWESMIQRCTNPNRISYDNYGGRGISVCDKWKNFENFLLDIGEPPTEKHSLDRIDNDGNYCPENCRWATRKEQARNTRKNKFINFNGKMWCISELAEKYNIAPSTLFSRINRGISVHEALRISYSEESSENVPF